MGFFYAMKRYLLTGYFDSMQFGCVSQDIADSNNFDTLQTLLENLMWWDIQMDILDTETKTILLRTNDYNPPKEHGRAK
jgi:hypothetical protein